MQRSPIQSAGLVSSEQASGDLGVRSLSRLVSRTGSLRMGTISRTDSEDGDFGGVARRA